MVLKLSNHRIDKFFEPGPYSGPMTVLCNIQLEYESEAEAIAVMEAISPDNAPYAQAVRDGAKINITSRSQTCPQMLHTMEDLLACVRVAEETVQVSK
jgi:hypothetical protein